MHSVHMPLFWRPQVLRISRFSRFFLNLAQCLFIIALSGPQDFMRFVRPADRQNSGKHSLRMIVKVANRCLHLEAITYICLELIS